MIRPGFEGSEWQLVVLALITGVLAGGGYYTIIPVLVLLAFLWVLRRPKDRNGPPEE